ncbi:MAG TPA: hypothetical protein PK122_01080 [Candidatus Paceibacterota bacterium]|nr:hypothetical protein [Candidatus Paceibacterota bacterium]
MKKSIKIQFPNGDIFFVPSQVIAENRANYYSSVDGYEIGSNEWLEEVDYALNSEYEIEDWLRNNMNWSDLEPYATREEEYEDIDYEEDFPDVSIEMC